MEGGGRGCHLIPGTANPRAWYRPLCAAAALRPHHHPLASTPSARDSDLYEKDALALLVTENSLVFSFTLLLLLRGQVVSNHKPYCF